LRGSVDPVVEAEFPGLTLTYELVDVERRKSSREVTDSLARLARRVNGATAVTLRTGPIVLAYRTFYRQIGLDPDQTPPPAEQAVLERLHHGGFRAQGTIADALTLAAVETGVGVWAIDLGHLQEPPPLRLGADHTGALTVSATAAVATNLFDDATKHAALYSLAVAGVPQLAVEEAMWIARDAVSCGGKLD
jgi:DNA/RNA-binding domain of Phe-tRNA-synthetase-like protein